MEKIERGSVREEGVTRTKRSDTREWGCVQRTVYLFGLRPGAEDEQVKVREAGQNRIVENLECYAEFRLFSKGDRERQSPGEESERIVRNALGSGREAASEKELQ